LQRMICTATTESNRVLCQKVVEIETSLHVKKLWRLGALLLWRHAIRWQHLKLFDRY
jgi:hypothetical protein